MVLSLAAVSAIILAVFLIFNNKEENNSDFESSNTAQSVVTDKMATNEAQIEDNQSVTNRTEEGSSAVSVPKKIFNDGKKVDVVVDSWLKVTEIGNYNGKLCAAVENVSSSDVEFAYLQCKVGGKTVTFKITALLSGHKAIVTNLDGIEYKSTARCKDWTIANTVEFASKRSLHNNEIVIKEGNRSLEVKNISMDDINSTILICYKKVNNGIYNGDITYRVRVEGLKKGETKKVNAGNFIKDECKVIFVDYGN